MYHKYTLLVGGAQYELPSDCVKNWDNIYSSIKRNDYDGIQRTFTSKFEFVNQAYSLLKAEYKANYLSASATIIFSRRNNSWTYNETFRCKLDFSDIEDDGFTFSISGIDDSMKNIIKSNGGTEYEFNVDELMHFEKLAYDGVEVEQSARWSITGDSGIDDTEVSFNTIYNVANNYTIIPLYILGNPEVIFKNSIVGIRDQEHKSLYGIVFDDNNASNEFIRVYGDVKINLNIKFSFNSPDVNGGGYARMLLCKGGNGFDKIKIIKQQNVYGGNYVDFSYEGEIDFVASEGYNSLLIVVEIGPSSYGKSYKINVKNSNISATWTERRSSPISLPFIFPNRLLTALVNKMTGDNSTYGVIDATYDSRLNGTLILAAESIRDILPTENNPGGAKIYTSFNKFRDWMSATFGYTYDIEGYNIIFRHRSQEFDNTVVKTIDHYANCVESVNSKIIYSRIKAGYDQQDYEEVNGRDAYHFGIVFSTGLTLTDTELNLVSPYRCDPLGIEILTTKRGQNTTDNSSDKNIFFVGATYKIHPSDIIGRYALNRDGYTVSNVISPETQFNAMFSPRASIEANKQLIGACTKKLTFASSEGNSDVIINGVGEKDDFVIKESDRIFTVGTITFETSDLERPTNFKGVIELEHRDGSKFGYIEEIEMNEGKNSPPKYRLIERT